jgi:hypothetical protein
MKQHQTLVESVKSRAETSCVTVWGPDGKQLSEERCFMWMRSSVDLGLYVST